MESARCTQNSAIYNAVQFAELAAHELAQKRRSLVCPACGRPAFFRRETQNDRNPCFGARPHADGCELSAAQAAARTRAQVDALADLLNPANRIVLDFRYGTPEQPNQPIHSVAAQSVRTQDHPAAMPGWNTNAVTHMRLRPLLRLLTSAPTFLSSQQMIDIEGVGSIRVCDFFVPLKALSTQHERILMGVFGKIESAQYLPNDDAVWLNSGGCTEPSICIPLGLAAALMGRFEIKDAAYFSGADVLVLGAVRISQQGKKYVVLENPNHFMFDFPRDR